MPSIPQTFELYVDDGSGEPKFEPVLCRDAQEAISVARQMIHARGLASIEVRLMGSTLFTLQS